MGVAQRRTSTGAGDRRPAASRAASAKLDHGVARLNINLPKSEHRAIKAFAVQRDMTITDLVLAAVRKFVKEQ